MKRIAIQDANILIDLLKTGLFDHCLALQYHFTTTNIILAELYDEQVALVLPHIAAGRFTVIDITGEELVEIQLMSLEDTRLSEQDWSALYYAMRQDAILVTGDSHMRALAKEKSIEYHGIFWLLDQLVETTIISTTTACDVMKKIMMLNKRLPADECTKRMKVWCGDS